VQLRRVDVAGLAGVSNIAGQKANTIDYQNSLAIW
jgi:hypothetical protein